MILTHFSMNAKKLNENEFLAWTISSTPGPKIEYVLDHKVINGEIHYLLRYENKNLYPYDVWVPNIMATNMEALTNYWNKANPKDLKPNLNPNDKIAEENEENGSGNKSNKSQISHSSPKIKILQILNDSEFSVILPGETNISKIQKSELEKNYNEEYKEYLLQQLNKAKEQFPNMLDVVGEYLSSSK